MDRHNPIDVKIGDVMNGLEESLLALYPNHFNKLKTAYEILLYHLALMNMFIIKENMYPDYSEFINDLLISRSIEEEKNI